MFRLLGTTDRLQLTSPDGGWVGGWGGGGWWVGGWVGGGGAGGYVIYTCPSLHTGYVTRTESYIMSCLGGFFFKMRKLPSFKSSQISCYCYRSETNIQ